MTKNQNVTRIEWSCGVSEEGLLMLNLSIQDSNPVRAERLFKRLHKKYCVMVPERHKDKMYQ